jgi:serine/threonine protein phosphatase PrpC
MKITTYADTHPGIVRHWNEDSVRVWRGLGAWGVFDGMSGNSALGSDHVQSLIREMVCAALCDLPAASLTLALQRANAAVMAATELHPRVRGCGGAALIGQLSGDVLTWAHVGDCRLYGVRDGQLEQLTQDHSLENDYIKLGKITLEEAVDFPHKNVITRAIGMGHELEVDEDARRVRPGDKYMVCSDGIHGMLSDAQIARILTHPGLQHDDLIERLILEANMAGGKDNIAAVVMTVE